VKVVGPDTPRIEVTDRGRGAVVTDDDPHFGSTVSHTWPRDRLPPETSRPRTGVE
jgi:hypothetical protein